MKPERTEVVAEHIVSIEESGSNSQILLKRVSGPRNKEIGRYPISFHRDSQHSRGLGAGDAAVSGMRTSEARKPALDIPAFAGTSHI